MNKPFLSVVLLAALLILAFVVGSKFPFFAGCGDSWHVVSIGAETPGLPVVIFIDECEKLASFTYLYAGGPSEIKVMDFRGKGGEEPTAFELFRETD